MGDGPKDDIARAAVAQGDRAVIRAILDEVCRITDMGFAAVARVTDTRWIVCQVLDKIEFGLDPATSSNCRRRSATRSASRTRR